MDVEVRMKEEGEMKGVGGGALLEADEGELRRKPRYSSRIRRRILRTMLPVANSEWRWPPSARETQAHE